MILRASGLTGRAMLATCSVAVVSVLVTALVALPLGLSYAQSDAKAVLRTKAQIIVDLVNAAPDTWDQGQVARRLRTNSSVDLVVIQDGIPDRPGLPTNVVRDVANGVIVECRVVKFRGEEMLAEGRPLAIHGNGIVMLQPPIVGTSPAVWQRLWLALVAGLAASLIAAFLLARRQARPIRQAAAAARQISAGDRTVRLAVNPPNEVADLSRALNDLATDLAISEGRQRDFLLSVSHELRTPLTTIRGYAEALADRVIRGEDSPGAGRTILAEADRLDRLVADLLALARLEAADFPVEPFAVELGSLISGAVEAWRPRCADAGLDLRTELPPNPVIVDTDPGRLRQVVDILISNAIRTLPSGAPLVLATRPDTLEVRDGGPGLADEDLEVAFEQGVLHEKYRELRPVGSGLGLALAARLVRRMGGEIVAGHAVEGGARFTIHFA